MRKPPFVVHQQRSFVLLPLLLAVVLHTLPWATVPNGLEEFHFSRFTPSRTG